MKNHILKITTIKHATHTSFIINWDIFIYFRLFKVFFYEIASNSLLRFSAHVFSLYDKCVWWLHYLINSVCDKHFIRRHLSGSFSIRENEKNYLMKWKDIFSKLELRAWYDLICMSDWWIFTFFVLIATVGRNEFRLVLLWRTLTFEWVFLQSIFRKMLRNS